MRVTSRVFINEATEWRGVGAQVKAELRRGDGTLRSNLVGPFDVSAYISSPGERDEEGTRVRVKEPFNPRLIGGSRCGIT
jgi:hypothetical protein